MHDSETTSLRRRRPRAVSFVASLLIIESALVVALGLVLGAGELLTVDAFGRNAEELIGPLMSALPGLTLAITIVVVGSGLAIAALGLLALREWAWMMAMALQGLGLANALYGQWRGEPAYITLAIGSFVVLALNQREVRQAFHEHQLHA